MGKEETSKTDKVDIKKTTKEFEKVLANVEEEDDTKAAERAKAEQDSELLEFHDSTQELASKKELSKVEASLINLESELQPIERLALRFMESSNTYLVENE